MNVVLYGASGTIGSRILHELVTRGHQVTAVVRNASKLPSQAGVTVKTGDVLNPHDVAQNVKGADAVISAFAPPADDVGVLVEATKTLIAGLTQAHVKRVIVVGGAGSLEVAPGVQLVDTPEFPADWKQIALAHVEALKVLRGANLDWTSFSPAAFIEPGERTGQFRLGTNQLIADSKGESRISAEDYAIALVDELENSQHIRERFTVGY